MSEDPKSLAEMAEHEFFRCRRRALGLTQAQVAERVGSTQPAIADLEAGKRPISARIHHLLETALAADPAQLLDQHREDIRAAVQNAGLENPRIFGSVARGESTAKSDIDLFVDFPEGVRRSAFILFALADDLENILSVAVDVRTPPYVLDGRAEYLRAEAEAVAL